MATPTQRKVDAAVAVAVAAHTAVLAQSKPDLVPALRSRWRASVEHRTMQLWRVVRLFSIAFVGQLIAQLMAQFISTGDFQGLTHMTQKTLVALLIGVGEAAYRQIKPAMTASAVDSAQGATIVPDQVAGAQDVTLPTPVVVNDPPAPPLDSGTEGDAAP